MNPYMYVCNQGTAEGRGGPGTEQMDGMACVHVRCWLRAEAGEGLK